MTSQDHGAAREEELALLLDAVQDYAIFLLSPDGEIRSWNAGACRVMGYEGPEVIGKKFSIFYGPEDLANRKPQRELEVAAAQGRIEDEGWRIRKDGTRFWADTIITALRHNDGRIRGFAKVTRDLTERRAGDERLRRSEELFRLLVSAVKDYAIFLLDPEGYVATWNEGAHRIKGYVPEEIVGRHFSVFYTDEDRKEGKPEKNLNEARVKGSVEDEGWRLRRDGTRFWASVVITAIHDDSGELRGFTKVTRDDTERKRAEEVQMALLHQREARLQAEEERRRAEASYRVVQEANRAKDEFLMTLSHELRTPMTAILGWSRLLATLPPDDAIFSEAIMAIARSAQLQAHLIDDVLDVSRIVSGKMRLSIEKMDVTRMIRGAVDAVRPSADAKQIRIDIVAAPDLGDIVADPTRMQQVLWNLLTNAVKFTPKHGVVEVRAQQTSSHLEVSVHDSGEGIEPHFLPHVFEPFRQSESPRTRVHGGLGLGLSIVRYIVEAHGGNVFAESAGKGQGATFTVTFPIGAVVAEQEESRASFDATMPKAAASDRLAGMTILLVDDDPEARRLVCAVLRRAGASVTAVESAKRAHEALDLGRPDLIITDIAMPDTDGFALARSIRQRKELAGVKIVALSAFPAGKLSTERTGFDMYLMKPIDPLALVEAIASAA